MMLPLRSWWLADYSHTSQCSRFESTRECFLVTASRFLSWCGREAAEGDTGSRVDRGNFPMVQDVTYRNLRRRFNRATYDLLLPRYFGEHFQYLTPLTEPSYRRTLHTELANSPKASTCSSFSPCMQPGFVREHEYYIAHPALPAFLYLTSFRLPARDLRARPCDPPRTGVPPRS